LNYSPHQILNSDHCSFQQEYISPRTLSFTGERTTEVAVKRKNNLTHSYTVQPITSADGQLLDKFFLILQEKENEFGTRVQKDLIVPPNIVVRVGMGKVNFFWHRNSIGIGSIFLRIVSEPESLNYLRIGIGIVIADPDSDTNSRFRIAHIQ
jgi:hypothetical protein